MAVFLISTVETYRVDTETQVKELIESAKKDPSYTLSKYSSQKKERKQKGEVVDEWYRVTLTKVFEDEKDPCVETKIEYKSSAVSREMNFDNEDDE